MSKINNQNITNLKLNLNYQSKTLEPEYITYTQAMAAFERMFELECKIQSNYLEYAELCHNDNISERKREILKKRSIQEWQSLREELLELKNNIINKILSIRV